MKYILIGIVAGLLSFIINVKAQDVTSKTFTKEVMCSEHAFVTNDLEKHHKQFRKWWAVSNQNELIELMTKNGFSNSEYRNLSNGLSAIHSGWKI